MNGRGNYGERSERVGELEGRRAPRGGFRRGRAGGITSTIRVMEKRVRAWREGNHKQSLEKLPERRARFETWSGSEVPDVLTPADVDIDYERDLGLPGEYP